jgi:hypothetical protein
MVRILILSTENLNQSESIPSTFPYLSVSLLFPGLYYRRSLFGQVTNLDAERQAENLRKKAIGNVLLPEIVIPMHPAIMILRKRQIRGSKLMDRVRSCQRMMRG